MHALCSTSQVFFFKDTATTEIYTLSLHDALPICLSDEMYAEQGARLLPDAEAVFGEAELIVKVKEPQPEEVARLEPRQDRKSTRLNSSHANISYAVFCLKKKNVSTQCTRGDAMPA